MVYIRTDVVGEDVNDQDWADILRYAHAYLTSPATRAAYPSPRAEELLKRVNILYRRTVTNG